MSTTDGIFLAIPRARPDGGGTDRLDSIFCHPDEVLADRRMTKDQKRALLAAWASDAHAVECAPMLRQLESGAVVRLADVMAALKRLDELEAGARLATGEQEPPRRGLLRAMPRRLRPQTSVDDDDDPPPSAPASRRPSWAPRWTVRSTPPRRATGRSPLWSEDACDVPDAA